MTDSTDNIIQQPPGHPNSGRSRAANDDGEWGIVPLDVSAQQVVDLLTPSDASEANPAPFGAGVGIVDTSRGRGTVGTYGATDAGMTAHRGILHPEEYVDYFELRERVEADLGFTYAAIAAAYKNGRPSADQRQHRDEIDSRLLALRRAGGNMALLAQAVGLNEKTLDRALARASLAEIVPIVRNPAVVKTQPCFICSEPGRKRKRASSDTPAHLRGYVVLCDDHYAAGFESRKGNPAYWDFRDAKTPLRGGPARPAKRAQRFPDNYPSEQSYADFVAGERM